MKIVIAPMVWKRPKVFDVFAEGVLILKELFETDDLEIQIMCVGSEGETSRQMVEQYGFEYREFPNSPLSAKAQYRLNEVRKLDPDYVMFISSDDFVTPGYFAYVLELMYRGYEFIAPYDIYYVKDMKLYYEYGYTKYHRRNGEPYAVGRALSKSLLDRIDWVLWTHALDRGLDGEAWYRTRDKAESRKFFRCKDIGGMIVDVKSSVNLSKWGRHMEHHLVTKQLEYVFDERIYKRLEAVYGPQENVPK